MFIKIFVLAILTVATCSRVVWKNDPRCGIRGKASEDQATDARIINGINASLNELPWQAALATLWPANMTEQPTDQWFLESGATIIHKQWVLVKATEALDDAQTNHSYQTLDEMQIWAGIVNDYDTVHQIVRNVSKRIVYPDRVLQRWGENDVALLKLDAELDFDLPGVKPICLPEPGMETEIDRLVGQQCTIAGWGETDRDAQEIMELAKSHILKKVNVTIWAQHYCEHTWAAFQGGITTTNMSVCAESYHQDTCWWDNGAALACYPNQDQRWFMYGMASDSTCSLPYVPSRYARMSKYVDWIAQIIAEN